MKKLSLMLAAILLISTCLFVFASCENEDTESEADTESVTSEASEATSEDTSEEESEDTSKEESEDTSSEESEETSEPAEESQPDIFVYDIDRSKTKTNKALNKTYEVLDKDSNPLVEEQWVDEGGKELTDGTKGSSTGSDPAWMGIKGALSPATVTIDLGEAVEGIADFDISAYINDSWGVDLPAKVTVSVSEDNETFYEAGSITIEELDVSRDDSGVQVEDISIQLEKGVKAQYVKFTFEPNDSWIFLSEIEISTYE